MTSPADRPAIVAGARATIERGSKSFVLASRLFGRPTRERAWLLYAWCRACDDAIDGQVLGHASGETRDASGVFAAIWRKTERALAGELIGEVAFDALRLVARECGLPPAVAHAHLDGFRLDASGWRPVSEDDLLLYCYHVAGTVGTMMALVMGVSPNEHDILDRACDLGIAFQLANIARDIAEDHRAGRCYLPQAWLDEHALSEATLLALRHRPALVALRRRLAAMSLDYERSARVGAAHLPFRSRWAVLAAAGMYGRIARAAATQAGDRLEERVVTSFGRKLACAATAFFEALRPAPHIARDGLWSPPPLAELI